MMPSHRMMPSHVPFGSNKIPSQEQQDRPHLLFDSLMECKQCRRKLSYDTQFVCPNSGCPKGLDSSAMPIV